MPGASTTPSTLPTAAPTPPLPAISRIAILGGGPSGIATLARLLKFHPTHFPTIDLFERRGDVGGIWNYTEEVNPLVHYPQPLTSPTKSRSSVEPKVFLPLDDSRGKCATEVDQPIWSAVGVGQRGRVGEGNGESGDEGCTREWVFPSPVYPSLTANFPKQLMEWDDCPFGEEVDMFPGHEEILEYVRGYFRRLGVKEVRKCDRDRNGVNGEEGTGHGVRAWFGKVVRKVEKVPVEGGGVPGWRVVVGCVGDEAEPGEERYYDALVIASGRYSVPYIPSLPCLKEWVLAGGGKRRVEHSREFREVGERYRGKRILLVGASISATDILRLLTPMNPALPIYQSMRSPIPPSNPEILPVPSISHLDAVTGDIHLQSPTFSSTSPTVDPLTGVIHPPSTTTITTLKDIDLILFCTGYLLTAPYLPPMHPSTPSPRGTHIPHLLLHCICSPDPTLAWIGLPYRVSPWLVAAGQAGVVARLWSGYLTLSELEDADRGHMGEMGVGAEWERVLREMEGPGREGGACTHLLTPPRDWMFLDRLAGLSRAADRKLLVEGGGSGDGKGERRWVGDYAVWSEYLKRVRMRLGEVRERYNKAVGEGRSVRALEEIGFGVEEVMGWGNGTRVG